MDGLTSGSLFSPSRQGNNKVDGSASVLFIYTYMYIIYINNTHFRENNFDFGIFISVPIENKMLTHIPIFLYCYSS